MESISNECVAEQNLDAADVELRYGEVCALLYAFLDYVLEEFLKSFNSPSPHRRQGHC